MGYTTRSVQHSMWLAELLDYLRAGSSTKQLGSSLAEIVALRGFATRVTPIASVGGRASKP